MNLNLQYNKNWVVKCSESSEQNVDLYDIALLICANNYTTVFN